MGVITSLPEPIKLQINDLVQGNSDTFIIDSQTYDNNYEWTAKACLALLGNKRCKKAVFKLILRQGKMSKLNSALSKLLNSIESATFYGKGLVLFEESSWVKVWSNCSIESLAIKDKITEPGFINLCSGIMKNRSIKELTLGSLVVSDITELDKALRVNQTIKSLNIICEVRLANDSSDESLNSDVPSTTHTIKTSSYLLSDNSGVSQYSLFNYIEHVPNLILGLMKNKSVQKLYLENIDVDRESLVIWNETFKQNQCLKELEVKRGMNTGTALTILTALKRNRKISTLKLLECTFGEAGFMVLQDLLRENQGILKVEIRDLIKLRYSNEGVNDMRNLILILQGLTDNSFITEASISIHSSASYVPSFSPAELTTALRNLPEYNRSLTTLKIEGFKLSGDDVISLLTGLKSNETMQLCSLQGNLVEWKDLYNILDIVSTLPCLKVLDIQDNKINTLSDTEKLKGKYLANQCLSFIKESFILINKGILCDVRISQWFFEPMCYPNDIQHLIKSAKRTV